MCMKKIFILFAFLSIFYSGFSQTGSDFTSTSNSIKINTVLPSTLSDINKIDGKEEKVVIISKTVNQEDFDKICSKLKWIKRLNVDYDNLYLTNITSISNLKNLENLRVRNALNSHKSPFSLTPLTEIISLKEIDFYNTNVTNTEALATLVNLEKIVFYKSAVNSIDFLNATPLVKELNLYGDNHTFTNYSSLKNLQKLRILDISYNRVAIDENLKDIENLTEIRELYVENAGGITTLQFLANYDKLQTLNCDNNPNIVDFSGLKDLISLKKVSLTGDLITSINFLSNKSELRELNLGHTSITDISPLASCINIEKLFLNNTSIADISVLSNITKIKKLYIQNTPISDISSLSKLLELNELDISNTKITDISSLSNCKKLSSISIANTTISDIKPLYSVDKLGSIEINPLIPKAQQEALQVRFPLVRINSN